MRREPVWLETLDVLAIHDELLSQFGGRAGIRDPGLLESALASPRNHFAYGEKDPFRLAAAYANALTLDHPFVDGNKRIAFMAAYVFLAVNGFGIESPEEDVVHVMLALTEKSMSEKEFAAWLRSRSVRQKRR